MWRSLRCYSSEATYAVDDKKPSRIALEYDGVGQSFKLTTRPRGLGEASMTKAV